MFLHKLCSFAIVAAMIVLAPVERSPVERCNVRAREFDPWIPGRSRHRKAFQADREFPPPVLLRVQSKNPEKLSAGKLLVASRDLADPNFAQTVVLLVRYDANGVVGLVLNRRTELPLSRALEGLKAAKDRSDRVYLGGPVERAAVLGLLQSKARPEGAEHVIGGTYLIVSKPLFEQTISARPDPGAFRVYLGYAGWTKAQLQMEVALGAWFVFPADSQTVFSSDPDSLWPQMIRKTELKLARGESVFFRSCRWLQPNPTNGFYLHRD